MSSFNQPFRGLPAEIRLMIWEYVVIPTINVTEVVEDSLKRRPEARDGESQYECRPHPCSGQHQLSLDQSVFKSPLQFLAAVMTVNRVVRAEFIAVIQRYSLSFQVDLPVTSLSYFLVQQFQGAHVPKIRVLKVRAPFQPRHSSAVEAYRTYGSINPPDSRRSSQISKVGTHIPRSRPLVEQVEINIDSRSWSAEAASLTHILRNHSQPNHVPSFVDWAAAPDIERDFDVAGELISKRLAQEVVFNIQNINEEQKKHIAGWDHAWGRKQLSEHCVVTLGPLRLEAIEMHDLIEVGTYCYQIVFKPKSDG